MIHINIYDRSLQVEECCQLAASAATGGTAIFVGTVRNQTKGKSVTHLEFEASVPMAIKEMQKIAQTAQDRWHAEHIVIHHRVGRLEIGETAVIIVVATPHRKAAFEACAYCIDTLKETVPIWKKEYYTNGDSGWVNCERCASAAHAHD